MKDFLAEVVTLRQQQGSGDTQRGSLLQQQQGTSTVGAVLDIRHRIMRLVSTAGIANTSVELLLTC